MTLKVFERYGPFRVTSYPSYTCPTDLSVTETKDRKSDDEVTDRSGVKVVQYQKESRGDSRVKGNGLTISS